MMTLLGGLLIVWVSLGIGWACLKKLRVCCENSVERGVFGLALGLGILALVTLGAGSVLGLSRNAAWIFLGIAAAVACVPMRGMLAEIRRDGAAFSFERGWGWVPAICLLAVGALAFLAALAPPTGQDELCYHLVQPKNYVAAGRVYEVPFSSNALWPYLVQMLFTLGILLDGPVLAKLLHFIYFPLAMLAVYAFGRRFYDRPTAFFGALAFGFVPAVFVQASFAYIDNALAVYVFLAAYAACVWAREGGRGWALLAGSMAGLAASTKLLGLFAIPVVAAILFAARLLPGEGAQRRGIRGSEGVCFLIGLVLFGAAFYVRSWALRGNPVYPFYPQFFGEHGWQDLSYVNVHGRQGPLAIPLLLWDITVHPEWFGGEHLGPVFLIFLPIFAMTGFLLPKKSAWWVFAGAGVYTVCWLLVDPNMRFLFPALLLAAVPIGCAIARVVTSPAWPVRWFFRALTAAIGALSVAVAVHHFADPAGLAFAGRGASDRYLESHERTFAAARRINAALATTDRILALGEVRGFYFNNLFVLHGDFERMTRYADRVKNPEELSAYLKLQGITHLLLRTDVHGKLGGADGADPIPESLQKLVADDGLARPEMTVQSGDNVYHLRKLA